MKKLPGFGAPKPVNTLAVNTTTNPRQPIPSTSVTTRSSPPLPPPVKRQRIEGNAPTPTHTNLQFAPSLDWAANDKNPRKRVRSEASGVDDSPTLSVQSLGSKSSHLNVKENRVVEKNNTYPRKKRQRYSKRAPGTRTDEGRMEGPSGKSPASCLTSSEVEDEPKDHDVDIVECQPVPSVSGGQEGNAAQERPIGDYEGRFRKKGNGSSLTLDTRANALEKFIKVLDNTDPKRQKIPSNSPDELAPNADDFKRVSVRQPLQPSPSLSTKGDILRTKFNRTKPPKPKVVEASDADRDLAKDIVGDGLSIICGASGRYKYYQSHVPEANRCFLSAGMISTILRPTDQAGNPLKQYEYLTVNLGNVTEIARCEQRHESNIILVAQSLDHMTGAGPKLMLELANRNSCDKFMQWALMKRVESRTLQIKHCSPAILTKQFQELLKRAERDTVLRDEDSVADDMLLIAHNKQARSRVAQRPGHGPSGVAPRLKLKDAMRPSPSSRSTQNDDVVTQSADTDEHNGQRTERTTRWTFALRDSPKRFGPRPEIWTMANPDWEKQWLDEGQFLNDNLVIFYLRYLQDKLERERPDLAQRIYFQNTFFYDKLKPSKNSRGIDYDSVKAWTSKVDIFTKDFIVVPINEYNHWYVAIIYNAPKLVPSPNGSGTLVPDQRASTPIEDEAEVAQTPRELPAGTATTRGLLDDETIKATAESDVLSDLSRMSINSPDILVSEAKQATDSKQDTVHDDARSDEPSSVIHIVKDSDESKADLEQISDPVSSQSRKKPGKRHNTGLRKHNLDAPKIITLDSLGGTHSPTCSFLRSYLVAELKDKRDIEIANPGALGMTAKGVPEQSNHCDCGVYVLGYIEEFLKNPDKFVRSLLQHDDEIEWNLDPSVLRNEIRDLIFAMQREQQRKEDVIREKKRQARSKKMTTAEETGDSQKPAVSPAEKHSDAPAEAKAMREKCGTEGEASHVATDPRPPSSSCHSETRGASKGNIQSGSPDVMGKGGTPRPQSSSSNDRGGVRMLNQPVDQEGDSGGKERYVELQSDSTPLEVLPRVHGENPESGDGQLFLNGEGDVQTKIRNHQGHSRGEESKAITKVKSATVLLSPGPSTQTLESGDELSMPGTFPTSPAVRANAGTKYRLSSPSGDSVDDIKKRFLQPLEFPSESSRDGTPTNPMLVEDSEAVRHSTGDDAQRRQNGQPRKPKLVVELSTVSSRNQQSHAGTQPDRRKETSSQSRHFPPRKETTQSHHFAGRQPGDRMASAKLHDDDAEHKVIDISD
ncbi:Uu.00g089210.m01.CDS01 [Anthostomella pinea]|uniref:Uu.00g089210.m01.CDS01 n=1 Tax=Anthostomella pinea TaxID=933095 RepID=A0AAI8VNU8_9PEZI|nr:Uu.00g089210.m01.CDS01 [Anthostomella pinea]